MTHASMARSWSLLLFFLVSSAPLMLAAAADGQGGEHCPTVPVPCGKVNITFPFAIVPVPEEATEISCGAIGFQVICQNNTPYLGYNRLYSHQFQILDIFYDKASLLVEDTHKLQDLSSSASKPCHVPTNNSSTKLGLPFSISPVNQNLIFYNCTKPMAEKERHSRGLVETICGSHTFVGVGGSYDNVSGSYDSYFLEGCNATVVPVLGGPGKANASRYKDLISNGFLLTWQAPPNSGREYVNATSSCHAPIYAYLGGTYYWDRPPAIATGGCTYSYVPVLGSEAADMTAANYSRLLKDGFVLEWDAAGVGDCAACSASGGQCLYDNAATAFRCLCPDGGQAGSPCAGE